ncbi:MAG: DUF2341 domain-containing protein [Candidatus Thorarchaeota archaeon]
MTIIIFIPINIYDNNEESEEKNEKETFIPQASSSIPPNINFFKYYKIITINNESVPGFGSYENFPVLISILDSDMHDHVNQSNGNDIAFSNDTDWLDHEIEYFNKSYDETYAKLVAWVRIPSLSTSNNTIIYMYYGNGTMSSRQNPTGVWSDHYKGVWHLSESSGDVLDSTSYNSSGTIFGTVTRNAPGKADGAYSFGDNDEINFGDPIDGHLDFGTGSFTISFWLNITTDSGYYQLPIHKGATTYTDIGYDFETNTDASSLSFRICDNSENVEESPHLDISADIGNWIYLTGVVDRASNRIRIFKNGLQEGSGTDITGIGNINSDNPLLAPNSDYALYGLLDEIRICSIQRSAGWIATEYSNQDDPESFYILSSELVIDMIAPTYSNLIESSDLLELGETEVIRINVSDPSGILEVKIEFEGDNHSMNNIGGDTWQYDSWAPTIIGNYSYIIYMIDNLYNLNATSGSIEVIDNTPPTYSDPIESSDPLELGETEVIQINVSDPSGISQVKIEFGGDNHSMTPIGGNTWQYNSWKPDNWIFYEYIIYIEDNNGNWREIFNNITVIDTITPSAPILTNAPSGDVSGTLVFDWSDGSDPSGIFYYILIIDNETDPSITPGYIYRFNITNEGNESSYFELNATLPSGKYHYFLTQVDGAGHESPYTRGSFSINLNPNNNDFTIYLIIAVILISVAGSITAITIVRKKSHKKISPPRKKVSLKLILTHIAKISSQEPVSYQKDQIQSSREESFEKVDLEIDIDEVKSLGEELFKEGAYLEAIKQFQSAKEILLKQGKNEEVALLSDLIAGIEGLIDEREKRLEILGKEKIDGDSVKVFDLYYDIIEISKKLRDFDAINMFQSELYQFFQTRKFKLIDIENHRLELEKKADSFSNNGYFEMAAQIYGKCEEISQFLVKLEKEEEIANVEKFKNKKNENLEKFS